MSLRVSRRILSRVLSYDQKAYFVSVFVYGVVCPMQSASVLDTCTYCIHGSFVYRYLYNMDNFVNQMTPPFSPSILICYSKCVISTENQSINQIRQLLHWLTDQQDPAWYLFLCLSIGPCSEICGQSTPMNGEEIQLSTPQ